MRGETNLDTLFKSLSASLADGVYVFVTLPENALPQNINAKMIFGEAEGTTLILPKEEAEAHQLAYEFPSKMITLNVHSSLEAVGFIAAIATELAKHDMGVNPVSGFYHDHLFIPLGREAEAMEILAQIAERTH